MFFHNTVFFSGSTSFDVNSRKRFKIRVSEREFSMSVSIVLPHEKLSIKLFTDIQTIRHQLSIVMLG